MPSVALARWHAERLPQVRAIEAEVAAALARTPPDPVLTDELRRASIVLLSAHVQGFCRDLYREAVNVVVQKVRVGLRLAVQAQFTSSYALGHGNPTLANVQKDFGRFGFALPVAADPANGVRLQHLAELNRWRNLVAHGEDLPPAGLPTPAVVRGWAVSCDGLAAALDRLVYNALRKLLRRSPWPP